MYSCRCCGNDIDYVEGHIKHGNPVKFKWFCKHKRRYFGGMGEMGNHSHHCTNNSKIIIRKYSGNTKEKLYEFLQMSEMFY